MTPFKAIIFDVDGTLSETEEIHRRAFNETFDYFGLQVTPVIRMQIHQK